jgi:hypothetical protein
MRFVLVNGRAPRLASVCSFCGESIGEGYLRNLSTGRVYCNRTCYLGPSRLAASVARQTVSNRRAMNGWRGLLMGLLPVPGHSNPREVSAPVSRPLATKRCS